MNGLRIAKPNADISSNPSQMQLDTSLETLPQALFGEFNINIYTGYEVGVRPYLEYEITHGLGYVPLFKAWELQVVSGESRYVSIPTGLDANGFSTIITATKQVVYIRAEYSAIQYLGSTYRKKGYVYIYKKKFIGLPE